MSIKSLCRDASRLLPDALYLHLRYLQRMHRPLNLKQPIRFTEKLQWLKLYDRNPLYPTLVDKIAVKDYVASKIGDQYIIPTLGVWSRPEEIDFTALPERYVLKCNHDSGGLVLCPQPGSVDPAAACRRLSRSLQTNYFWHGREWPYGKLTPRILAEPYLRQADGSDVVDYKLFCFGGKPEFTLVCSNRFATTGLQETVFDLDWNRLPLEWVDHPASGEEIPAPSQYALMQELAATLSEGLPFLRVDFYEVEGRVYFGELTLYPTSGLTGFSPDSWDGILGAKLHLPRS